MSVWILLKNIGTVLSLLKAIRDVVGGVATTKTFPPAEQIKAVLDHLEDLLDRGVIDVPGVDEAALSEALKQIEEFLMKGVKPAA